MIEGTDPHGDRLKMAAKYKDIYDEYLTYTTDSGMAVCGDSLNVINLIPDESIDLLFTSPPFALQREKEYGNKIQEEYVDWFMQFAESVLPKLKENGSFVIDLGGAYCKGRPVRSLYQYRLLIRLCDELGLKLAEEFFWHNPSKLPSPIEWVNKRKIRAKDSVNTEWWLSKSDFPKSNVKEVLVPYSDRMKQLLKNPDEFYLPKNRPSGHSVSENFRRDNGGSLPSNLLSIPNTDSNGHYLRYCKELGLKGHPARFPITLPEFFIKFLTEPGDLVVDIFAGSNTSGLAAQRLDRNWLSIELNKSYMATSVLRFCDTFELADELYGKLMSGQSVEIATE